MNISTSESCSNDFHCASSGGESKNDFWNMVHLSTNILPKSKPRYLMGVGFAVDLVVCSALGIDMYDCVFPTRTAVSILCISYGIDYSKTSAVTKFLVLESTEIRLRVGENGTAQSKAATIQKRHQTDRRVLRM